ncbi:MAG TPA: beta-galactosidase [Acetobacteraceae bacterium]|nr:beta-galactosidase [Acetobacteraceae bacterium]
MKRLLLAAALLAGLAAPAHAARDSHPWGRFRIIEWQPRTSVQLATLKQIGVSAGMVLANRNGGGLNTTAAGALRSAGMRCYVENIATDFYSAYHIWTPGKETNWRFTALQRQYAADPHDASVFVRHPGLSDPVWLRRIARRLAVTVRAAQPYRPLYYSLGDETGIADLAAFWDFDTSPESLAGFRVWLRTQYPSLAALNAEWGADYAHWADVQPEPTRAAMRRTDGNFAAWSDFKAWMDIAFARAVRAGTAAIHRADPQARSAIEGAQVPGWGGYDYTLLAHTVDVMEIYDTDENLALLRAFNPAVIPLVTAGSADPAERHWIWREWLRGARGLVLWDPDQTIVRPDGTLGPAGIADAPLFAALRGKLGSTVLAARPHTDPVAILYSPASFRTSWMLEHQPAGDAWITRTAADEDNGDAQRMALTADARALRQIGLAPRYLGPAHLADGGLRGIRLLVLPHAIALSERDAAAIRRFVAAGGFVAADVVPGTFDQHGRRRPASPLAALFAAEGRARLLPAGDPGGLQALAADAGVRPAVAVAAPDHDVTRYVFRSGTGTIVAVQRRFVPGTGTEQVRIELPSPQDVVDLVDGRKLGRVRTVTVRLGTVRPAVFAVGAVRGG